MNQSPSNKPGIVDPFGRTITYLRLSVTDRCDFRCVYCMAEEMVFLPKKELLSLEESLSIARALVELGVTKIRLTGGEPLVRKNIGWLASKLGKLDGLNELTLTTNGSQLERYAKTLIESGVKRINISMDSTDPKEFRQITRTGDIARVMKGIEAARQAGFERIKINAVIMKGLNDQQILPLLEFCLARDLDISFIEEMPLGNITDHSRPLAFISSNEVREKIATRYQLTPSIARTGGPSRYWQIPGQNIRIGFISPHSHNFCGDCNRVRLTAQGQLLLCLGHENAIDLRAVVRRYPGEIKPIQDALLGGIVNKPERHEFTHSDHLQVVRFMNMTGG